MEGKGAPRQLDALLLPYVQAADEADSERLLAALVAEHVEPVIRNVLRSKLHTQFRAPRHPDADDLYGETLVQLLARLKECKASPSEKTIGNLRHYAAVVSYHTYYEYLRVKHPLRTNLKNKLRYALTHLPGLALWENERGDLVAGFDAWRERALPGTRGDRLRQLLEDPFSALRSGDFGRATPSNLADLAAAVFNYVNHPIELDELVGIVAARLGVKDQAETADAYDPDDPAGDPFAAMADERVDVAGEVDHRLFLKWLWEEICQLPVRQRMALLLNLRDEQGGGLAALLPVMGIASLSRIAAALEMTPEEFARLWPRLPLDDASIAELLGLTRQQIINLRKSARERLARRMKTTVKK